MPTDNEKMKVDFRARKELCMVTIKACKKLVAMSDKVPKEAGVAFFVGLEELERVVEDHFGII